MSTMDVVFDLETVRDTTIPWKGEEEGRVAPAPHNRIVAAGKLLLVDLKLRAVSVVVNDAEAGVRSLIRTLNDSRTRAVTWGGRRFDMPVLGAECLRLGIPFPRYFAPKAKGDDFRYRYNETPHLDLMDMMSDHGAALNASLDAASRVCGLPGKLDGDGGKVADMAAAGKWEEIATYNAQDLVCVGVVYIRSRYLQGKMPSAFYRATMAAFIADLREQAPSLVPYLDLINMDRLLSVGEPERGG